MIRFKTRYGAMFTNTINTPELREDWKRDWYFTLQDLSKSEISNGIRNTGRECNFAPTPAKFRELAKQDSAIYEQTYWSAVDSVKTGKWEDKQIYWTAVAFGWRELEEKSLTPQNLVKWKKTYREIGEHAPHAEIPARPQLRLPEPGNTFNRETAFAALRQAKGILKGNLCAGS